MGFNINNNYGPNIDVHDGGVVHLHQEQDGRWHSEGQEIQEVEIIEPLKSEQAETMKTVLTDAQLLTDDWQPNGLSGTERGLLAKTLGERLGIKDVWKVFGQLWNEKPETLRRNFNKALEQRKSLDFQDRLQNILS